MWNADYGKQLTRTSWLDPVVKFGPRTLWIYSVLKKKFLKFDLTWKRLSPILLTYLAQGFRCRLNEYCTSTALNTLSFSRCELLEHVCFLDLSGKKPLLILTLLIASGGTRNKFRNELQFFIAYAYELYEFAQRIKQYSPLNQEWN